MFKEPAIALIDNHDDVVNGKYIHIIGLNLDIFGQYLKLNLGVKRQETSLAALVPLARQLSERIINTAVKVLKAEGKHIPCKAGCSKCCSYLVPLTVPEAIRLNMEIAQMEKWHRERVNIKCLSASKKILESKVLKSSDINQLGSKYSELKVACPFARQGMCTVYWQRPLVCREHLVTGAENCARSEKVDIIEMPVRMSDVLGTVSAELEGRQVEAVILPLLMAWNDNNAERPPRRYSAVMAAERIASLMMQLNKAHQET